MDLLSNSFLQIDSHITASHVPKSARKWLGPVTDRVWDAAITTSPPSSKTFNLLFYYVTN